MNELPFSRGLLRRRNRESVSRTRGVVRRVFTDSLLALPPARHHVRDTLTSWQLTEDEQDTIVLVANELVSNAVTHARTASRMTLRRSRCVVHVLVRDYSPRPPQSPVPIAPVGATAGCHGLDVIDAASVRWGWHHHTIGKTVWATITTTSASPPRFA